MMSQQMDRRTFLRVTGLVAAATTATVVLASCSPGPGSAFGGGGPQTLGALELPTFRGPDFLTPDLVSAHAGGLSGFFTYPDPPVQVFKKPPLSGGTVTAMTYTFGQVVPSVQDNVFWQHINEQLGAKLDIIYTPAAEYANRFATTIAGASLPDIVTVRPPVQQLPQLLKAKFSDLTDHLAGDAVLDYPGLAAIPTDAWRSTVFDQGIWGVPMPRSPIGSPMFARADIIKDRDLPLAPKDWDEFKELLSGLTRESESTWSTASLLSLPTWLAGTYGLSGEWAESGGEFTHWSQTEEFEATLADVRSLADAGLIHPDGVTAQNTQANEWFTSGTVGLIIAGYVGWPRFIDWGAEIDGFELGAIVPFGRDGIEPAHNRSSVAPNFAAIKKGDAEHVKRMLTVLDWLCTPFGTSEFIDRTFGVPGKTFEFDGADPVLTDLGTSLAVQPVEYIANTLEPIYVPGARQVTQAQFDYQETVLPMITRDPILGLLSATDTAKGAGLRTLLSDAQTEIVAGRAPVSSWKDAAADWRAQGGDTIAKEYAEAHAALNS